MAPRARLPVLDVNPTGATITGGTWGATVDMSAMSPSGSATHIEWAVSYGSNTETEYAHTGSVAVGAIGTPFATQRILYPGNYVVYTRELASGSPISAWSTASSPSVVTAPSSVTGKAWWSDVMALTGPTALGTTIGRTSAAGINIIDGNTMTQSAINALLPAGASYSSSNQRITVTGTGVTLENYDMSNVGITINNNATCTVQQCIIRVAQQAIAAVQVLIGGRALGVSNCTFYGGRVFYNNAGAVNAVKNANGGTGPSQNYGKLDEVSYCYFVGLTQDPIKTSGSDAVGGSKIHHNVVEACGWIDGNASWELNNPHADSVTARGAFGGGVDLYYNFLNQAPFYILDSEYGKTGQWAGYAGNKLNKLGNTGIVSQNNWFRVAADTGNTPYWGRIRARQNINVRWLGMPGAPTQWSDNGGDAACYDNVMAGRTLDYTTYTNWANTDSVATIDHYYNGTVIPDYGAGSTDGEPNTNLNFWTGAELTQIGSEGSLASPL